MSELKEWQYPYFDASCYTCVPFVEQNTKQVSERDPNHSMSMSVYFNSLAAGINDTRMAIVAVVAKARITAWLFGKVNELT